MEYLTLISYIPYLIIALTTISSIMGFNNRELSDRLIFNVGAILGPSKQWYRLITSAFIHGDWMHLIFNMMTLYFFSYNIYQLGVWKYLIIYFASILGGGTLSLLMHRSQYYYSALGASGGVVGILFAAIALNPNMEISFMFIPVAIPGWIFGIAYIAYSIYGMKNNIGNIGHDAHMGGAVIGLLLVILFNPEILAANGLYIGIMTIPIIILGVFVWKEMRR